MVARLTMTLKYILVLIALTGANVNCKTTYKICVPSQYLSACEEMLQVDTKSKAILECIAARDRTSATRLAWAGDSYIPRERITIHFSLTIINSQSTGK
ncbi:jg12131 [Pararge aegeria aegeria]|uniref:Jg12131 protein n=1 Tax=Pararge aegeria aegeria TaxID=348720 RepID=A0A8S4QE48_9NEOP|nr:jg12131 [Pararge aegeria aegeria]